MNKLLLIFVLLILSSCGVDISESLFIASIGFEIEENEIKGYFYLPLSNDVGKSEKEGKGEGEFVKVGGENIERVFNNVKAVNSIDINLKHVSSIVLNQDLYNNDFIDQLIQYVKYSKLIDYNFYLFSTKEKMKDIYSFKNPNQESVLNSLLVISGDNIGLRLVAEPIHFLEFCKRYYDNRSILIPSLDIEELWNIDGKQVKNFYPQSAVYFYNGITVDVIKNVGSPYIKEKVQFYDMVNEDIIYFSYYRFRVNKDKIKIRCKYETFGKIIQEEEITNLINKRINDYVKEYMYLDPLDIEFWNECLNDGCSYQTLKIDIKILPN